MTEEAELLRQYVETRSPGAFAQLVARYVDLVYSCAKRQLGGDAHLAEDVTQSAFLLLAQKAEHVPLDRPVSAWLVKAAGYFASNARRSRERRLTHERRAVEMAPVDQNSGKGEPDWELLSPMLDVGMSKLPREYRDALLLRFFEKKSIQQVGDAMGVSKEAAQKRVERAVDKLRDFFVGRGVTTMSSLVLTTLLTEQAVNTAPTGLAASVVAAAGTSSPPAKGTAALFLGEKLKWVAAAAIIASLGIGGVIVFKAYQPPGKTVARMLPPASPVTPAVLPASWKATFTDGTEVEVLALTDPAKPQEWWTLNGTPTVDPQFPRGGVFTMSYSAARRLDVVMRMKGAQLRQKTVTLRSDQPYRTATRQAGGAAAEQLVHAIVPVARDRFSGNVRLGFAGGPWKDRCFWDVTSGEASAPSIDTPELELRGIFEEEGKTIVTVNAPALESQTSDVQLIVIADGSELKSGMGVSKGAVYTFQFRCPLSQVTKVVARTRAFEWIEYKNVAFWPSAKPTSVAIVTAERTTSMAPIGAP